MLRLREWSSTTILVYFQDKSVGHPNSKPQAKWNNFFCVLPTNCYHLLEIKDNNHVFEWGDVSSGSCYHRTTLPEVSSLVGDRNTTTFRTGNAEWLVNHEKRKGFRSSWFFTPFIKIFITSSFYYFAQDNHQPG